MAKALGVNIRPLHLMMSTRAVPRWVIVCGGFIIGFGLPGLLQFASGQRLDLTREVEWRAIGALMVPSQGFPSRYTAPEPHHAVHPSPTAEANSCMEARR